MTSTSLTAQNIRSSHYLLFPTFSLGILIRRKVISPLGKTLWVSSSLKLLTPCWVFLIVLPAVGLLTVILRLNSLPHTFFSNTALVHKFGEDPNLHRSNGA
ncbi:uncharacterized protein DS421_14g469270 [Arachis hypogaea]|nr:uncharacterized protein DS421_14g469270 [Arachis hypogaea]